MASFDTSTNCVSESFRRVVGEVVKLKVGTRFSALRGIKFDIDSMVDMVTEDLLFGMQANVTAVKGKRSSETKTDRDTVTKLFPKTWFDHFKQDCFPKWLLTKYPADYETVLVEIAKHHTTITTVTRMCPHLHTDPSNKHIEFLVRE
jgi:hypothetical protein